MKTPDWNDLKLGTVAVLDTVSKPNDFGFKMVKGQGTRSSFQYRFWNPSIIAERMTMHFKFCTLTDYVKHSVCK